MPRTPVRWEGGNNLYGQEIEQGRILYVSELPDELRDWAGVWAFYSDDEAQHDGCLVSSRLLTVIEPKAAEAASRQRTLF